MALLPGDREIAGPRVLLRPHLRTPIALAILWGLLLVVTITLKPAFFGRDAFLTITYGMAYLGTMAVGESIVLISGGLIDLSVGMVSAAAALLTARILQLGAPTSVAVLGALALGAAIGGINGGLIVFTRVNPIIATLGVTFIGNGLINIVFGDEFVPPNTALRHLGVGRVLGTPDVFWVMLALLVLTGVFLAKTRPGRHTIAVGGNKVAAAARGIGVARVRIVTFVFCGACAALAGVLLAAQVGIVQPSGFSPTSQFEVVTAVVLGGIALTGGSGNLLGLFASLLLLATMRPAFVTLGMSSAWESVVVGILLAVAVAVDAVQRKRSA